MSHWFFLSSPFDCILERCLPETTTTPPPPPSPLNFFARWAAPYGTNKTSDSKWRLGRRILCTPMLLVSFSLNLRNNLRTIFRQSHLHCGMYIERWELITPIFNLSWQGIRDFLKLHSPRQLCSLNANHFLSFFLSFSLSLCLSLSLSLSLHHIYILHTSKIDVWWDHTRNLCFCFWRFLNSIDWYLLFQLTLLLWA